MYLVQNMVLYGLMLNPIRWSNSVHVEQMPIFIRFFNAQTAKKRLVGILASQSSWSKIMRLTSACTNFIQQSLWYYHYDNNPFFIDYAKYALGGWTTPSIKQSVDDITILLELI